MPTFYRTNWCCDSAISRICNFVDTIDGSRCKIRRKYRPTTIWMNRSILAHARRAQHRRRKDSDYHVTVCQSHSQIDYHNTAHTSPATSHEGIIISGHHIAHRHAQKPDRHQLPVVAATHFLFPVSLPRGLFLVKLANLYKITGSNRTPPETTTDTVRETENAGERQGKGSQFAHILDGNPRGLPDLHPVRPRPRLVTKRKAVNHHFHLPWANLPLASVHTQIQTLYHADSLCHLFTNPNRSCLPPSNGRPNPSYPKTSKQATNQPSTLR